MTAATPGQAAVPGPRDLFAEVLWRYQATLGDGLHVLMDAADAYALAAPEPHAADGLSALADELERLAGEHSQKAAEYDRDAAEENFHRGCRAALDNTAGRIRDLIASQEPRPAPELQLGPCPFDGHDGEHLRLNTHGHWLCAITLTDMLVAADVITDLQPAPALAAPELHAADGPAAAMRETASRELAAAMAESRRCREALQQVARHSDDDIGQVRIVAEIARRALEGK